MSVQLKQKGYGPWNHFQSCYLMININGNEYIV